MIRIIFPALVTLAFACSNVHPEPADTQTRTPETGQVAAPAEAVSAPLETELRTETAPVRTAGPVATTTISTNAHTENAINLPASSTQFVEVSPAVIETPAETTDTTNATTIAEVIVVTIPASQDDETPALTITPIGFESSISTDAANSSPLPVVQSSNKPIVASRKHFLPTRRRIDREINKLKFAYKGEVMVGLSASYGTLTSDNADFLTILNGIDADATIATVKPFLGYFYKDNHAVGARFGYTHTSGTINSATFDMGPSNDVSANIPYINLKSDNYAFGIFHRSYAGLDPRGRFGLFAEFELSMSMGSSEFTYNQDNTPKSSFSDNMQFKLSFNPGAAVYIFPNVCATISFGLGGIEYTSVTQKDAEGNKTGSRKASKMNFKLNIAAINIGMNVHLWDKKKK